MKPKAFRFLYRTPGLSGWTCYFALTAFNTAAGAARLVDEWNRKDWGIREWRADECLPGDVDHPDIIAKHLLAPERELDATEVGHAQFEADNLY